MPSAFVFDPNRCTGCQACEFACSIENDLGPDRSWREVVTFNDAAVAGVPRFHLSLACNHCAEPACMYSCPALAYERDGSSGAILLDPNRCIGCRYCSWACPYGAPTFEEERGVMGKCTFCSHRLEQGLKPACATLCPTGALDFQELAVSELAAAVPGFPQTDLGPSIRIELVRRPVHHGPDTTGGDASPPVAPPPPPSPGITLNSEWSLAAFTFVVVLLFAAFAAAVEGALFVPPLLFAAAAAGAAGFSLSHLGRPTRAWRAGLNIRRSWLSREVVGFGSFAVSGTVVLALGPSTQSPLAAVVVAIGLLTLVSADQVYRPVYSGLHPLLDGGGTLLTGLYLAGLVLADPWLAGLAGFIKLGSEIRNTSRRYAWNMGPWPALLACSRLVLGLALPAATWIGSGTPLPVWTIFAAIVGEAMGRAGFYTRLHSQSPARQARADLAGRLASSGA
jgi:Fe-S-cluster-containing dehydrogenase component